VDCNQYGHRPSFSLCEGRFSLLNTLSTLCPTYPIKFSNLANPILPGTTNRQTVLCRWISACVGGNASIDTYSTSSSQQRVLLKTTKTLQKLLHLMNRLFWLAYRPLFLAQNIHSLSRNPDFFVVVSQPSNYPSSESTRHSGKLVWINKPPALVPRLFTELTDSTHRRFREGEILGAFWATIGTDRSSSCLILKKGKLSRTLS